MRPSAEGEVAFSWKVSLDYLEDVVRNRPDWYVAHPVALDWTWLMDRVRDESRLLAQDRRGIAVSAVGLAIRGVVGSAAVQLARNCFALSQELTLQPHTCAPARC